MRETRWASIVLAAVWELSALGLILRLFLVLDNPQVAGASSALLWAFIGFAFPLISAGIVYEKSVSRGDDKLTAAAWGSLSILVARALEYLCGMQLRGLQIPHAAPTMFALDLAILAVAPLAVLYLRANSRFWSRSGPNPSQYPQPQESQPTSATPAPAPFPGMAPPSTVMSGPDLYWDADNASRQQTVSLSDLGGGGQNWQVASWPWWLRVAKSPDGLHFWPSNCGSYSGVVRLTSGGEDREIKVSSSIPASIGRRSAGFWGGLGAALLMAVATGLTYFLSFGSSLPIRGPDAGPLWLIQFLPYLSMAGGYYIWGGLIGGKALAWRSLLAAVAASVLVTAISGRASQSAVPGLTCIIAFPLWGLIVGGVWMLVRSILASIEAAALSIPIALAMSIILMSAGGGDGSGDAVFAFYGLAVIVWGVSAVLLSFGILGAMAAPLAQPPQGGDTEVLPPSIFGSVRMPEPEVTRKGVLVLIAVLGIVALVTIGLEIGRSGPNKELLQAARIGSGMSVDSILARGANVNARDEMGRTALMWSIARHDDFQMQTILRARPNVRIKDKHGHTALHYAVMSQNPGAVRAILALRPNVNAADENGVTPLTLSRQIGNFEINGMLEAYSNGSRY